MGATVRVGIVGDFDRGKHSHWAVDAALFHAAARMGVAVEPHWIATSSVSSANAEQRLARFSGIWAAPGSPYASMSGMLSAIAHARQNGVPFLGTCGGFQYALIEFTRSVLGIADADSAENDPDGKNIVITPVLCAMPQRSPSGPALLGLGTARPVSGSLIAKLCADRELGEYFCSMEANVAFVPRWESAGLSIAALGDRGEMRALELPGHRFFLATLFQPQLSSSYERPHPIIEGYLRACAGDAGG